MATKKATVKTDKKEIKLSAKAKAAVKKLTDEDGENEEDEEGGGKIAAIMALYVAGVPRRYIISVLGFNKTTVYRQTGEFEKLKKAPALKFHGYELYEARILRLMASKKLSRDKAIARIEELDNAGAE